MKNTFIHSQWQGAVAVHSSANPPFSELAKVSVLHLHVFSCSSSFYEPNKKAESFQQLPGDFKYLSKKRTGAEDREKRKRGPCYYPAAFVYQLYWVPADRWVVTVSAEPPSSPHLPPPSASHHFPSHAVTVYHALRRGSSTRLQASRWDKGKEEKFKTQPLILETCKSDSKLMELYEILKSVICRDIKRGEALLELYKLVLLKHSPSLPVIFLSLKASLFVFFKALQGGLRIQLPHPHPHYPFPLCLAVSETQPANEHDWDKT